MTTQLQNLNLLINMGEEVARNIRRCAGDAHTDAVLQETREKFCKPTGIVMDEWEVLLAYHMLFAEGALLDPQTLLDNGTRDALSRISRLQQALYLQTMMEDRDDYQDPEDYQQLLAEFEGEVSR